MTTKTAPGYNHDIPYRGIVYHVQTEFLRQPTPHIGTHVFCRGRIVEAETTILEEPLNGSSAELGPAMAAQHKTMIRRLVSGQVRDDDPTLDPPPSPPASDPGEPDADVVACRRPTDLRRHLELRRSAVRIVRAVRPEQPPPRELVRTRLGAVVSSMVDVALRHPYQQTRHEELAQLLMLRSEVIEWLGSSDPADPSDERGVALWTALTDMCEALRAVNLRRELVEHDGEILEQARARLARASEDAEVDRDLIESLQAVWGRHPPLDDLLDFCGAPRAGLLLPVVEAALESIEEARSASREAPSGRRPPRPAD